MKRNSAGRKVLGIDPGLACTGWGILEDGDRTIRYIDHGVIETKANLPRPERLLIILTHIRAIIKKYKPSEAAVEILFFGKNVTSAIPVAEARGVVSAAIAEHGIPLRELTPNSIKLGVTGTAKADKAQVQEMVRIILSLEKIPKPDHAADALAAAICAINIGTNIEV